MTFLLFSLATTAVAAASAASGVGMVLATVFGLRRAGANAAREEALALAATRAEVIRELEARVHALEQEYRVQRVATLALVELLADVRNDLEAAPPNVARARARIDAVSSARLPVV